MPAPRAPLPIWLLPIALLISVIALSCRPPSSLTVSGFLGLDTPTPTPPPATPTPNALAQAIVGSYRVHGENPGGGGSYEGALQISGTGGVLSLSWNVLRRVSSGQGFVQMNPNLLATSYASGPNTRCGVALYRIENDGKTLIGIWTKEQTGRLGTETATRIGASASPSPTMPLLGTYSVVGTTMDNIGYTSVLTIGAQGQLYRFTWGDPGPGRVGVGLVMSNTVSVSLGGDPCGVAVYRLPNDNQPSAQLVGQWALPTSTRAGPETAVRVIPTPTRPPATPTASPVPTPR
ncbi:MAG: hypothetical protein NZ518_10640 [Dehalococcoidia bacterium]|nr:hypothetical protein [Dehalococcoidia bacterium]